MEGNGSLCRSGPVRPIILAEGPDLPPRALLARLRTVVSLDSSDLELIVRRFRAAQYQPALLFSGAARETVARLEEHRYLLPGLVIQTEPRRTYPAGNAVAHLAGYVGEVSEDELDKDRYPGARMGSVVGRDGLEQQYDSVLRGVDGVRYTEVDARGRMVREEVSSPSLAPIAGNLVKTTIDLPLQQFVDSMWRAELAGTRGALVAMTPKGEILALYSAPTFDPNEFVGRIVEDRLLLDMRTVLAEQEGALTEAVCTWNSAIESICGE